MVDLSWNAPPGVSLTGALPVGRWFSRGGGQRKTGIASLFRTRRKNDDVNVRRTASSTSMRNENRSAVAHSIRRRAGSQVVEAVRWAITLAELFTAALKQSVTITDCRSQKPHPWSRTARPTPAGGRRGGGRETEAGGGTMIIDHDMATSTTRWSVKPRVATVSR